ncbi:MAG: RdgB/HAM1 family non-canonical purine NTP pyrophosphatase [Maricaulaceae bacterium]
MTAVSREWILASHNPGKLKELAALVAPFGVRVSSVADFGQPAPEETATTFIGNALIKARAAAAISGKTALSDDSGLAVAALDGAPGVYSADWAGEPRDFGRAMEKVHDALLAREATDWRAKFVCVLALAAPDGAEQVFEGEVHGRLVWPPRGDQGFGYDPMFVADGETETFGEMAPARKHAMSHRADAFAKLIDTVFRAGG